MVRGADPTNSGAYGSARSVRLGPMGRRIPFTPAVTWAATLGLFVAAVAARPASTRPATRPAATTQPVALLPQRWPGATYDVRRGDHLVSRVTFHTELARDDAGGPDRLRLADVLVLDPDGKARVIRVTTACLADDALTPERVTAEEAAPGLGKAAPADPIMDLRFERGLAVGTVRGAAAAVEAPPPVVTELTLFRLAVLMTLSGPRDGAEVRFNGLQSTAGRATGPQSLRCAGRERVRVAGREYDAWRFEHAGERIKPSTYWVNADGFFLRAVLGGTDEWEYAPAK